MISLSKNSWIIAEQDILTEYTKEIFDELWNLCPKTKEKVKIVGKLLEIPRFQKLYGSATYSFSRITLKPETKDIPFLVKLCMFKAKELYPEFSFNGALVNWYPDGSSYIGPHSDDEKDLEKKSPICSFSFGFSGRTFRLKEKKKQKDIFIPEIRFYTIDNSLIIMGGSTQKEFKHEILKSKEICGPRINITVRSFVVK
jgi:alkylated DNA repair dioxygenase AlkB